MEISDRVRELRKSLGQSQKEFSAQLGLGQSTLAMMEVSKRPISERHIKTICSIYNVNEQWLRTGEGEMLNNDSSSLISRLTEELHMTPDEQELIEVFMSFSQEERKSVIDFAKQFAVKLAMFPHSAVDQAPVVDPIQQELADYEAELRAQQQDASASATGAESIKNRA